MRARPSRSAAPLVIAGIAAALAMAPHERAVSAGPARSSWSADLAPSPRLRRPAVALRAGGKVGRSDIRDVEVLTSTGALPAHMAGQLSDPYGYSMTSRGDFIVLDRRAHAVFAIDRTRTTLRRVLEIGQEIGRIIEPGVISLAANDVFAVADAPAGFERVQTFTDSGSRIGGFYLPRRTSTRLTVGPIVVNGVGSMQYTGRSVLLNQPQLASLISELDLDGNVLRQVGTLRRTGYEADVELHHALNVGLPLADPLGGFFFVFQSGVPMFRKYSATGTLVFERHIEGPDIDGQILGLPTTWPARPAGSRTFPLVPALVMAAGVDRSGRLWISLASSHTYVYDRRGEKIRTVQFRGAGLLAPSSLFFAANGRLLVTPGCYEFTPPW